MPSNPSGLLDDHVTAAGPRFRLALTATASRNRSLDARELLARAALGEHGTLDQLLTAARGGDRRWLRRIRRRIDPGLVAALAHTLGLQELTETDRADALALFELIRRACGARALSPANQALHAQLALAHEGPERARKLMRRYLRIGEAARAGLHADLQAGKRTWPAAFQSLMPAPGPVVADGNGVPFDRIICAAPGRVEGTHRVSVIVTAYRPDRGLITAVRSILAQSWANIEVIIVDDASPPEFEPVLREAVALGERITLIRMPENSGTYAARNAGLDAAGGEFATFQDSDDWSHPLRVERQVRPLIDDRKLVATTSDGLAVTDQLMCTRPGVRSGRFNPSSLLLRRSAVLRTVGYFDRLRKAADSEYIGRIQAAFGAGRVRHVDSPPLALIRLSSGSLSRSEIRAHWMHPARTAYMSAYQRHHHLIAARRASAFRPADGSDRPFPAPDHLLGQVRGRAYDVVMVADWRFLESAQRAALDEIRALHTAGLRVALLQLDSYRAMQLRRVPLAAPVQDLVNDGVADRIAPDDPVEAALLVVRQAAVLQFTSGDTSRCRAARALIVADRAPVRSDGSDHRYDPPTCTDAVRRLFGADPLWVPQDPGVRAALREVGNLDPEDLPVALAPAGWVADRTGASAGAPIAGTDLCDAANWPPDAADSLAVCRRLPEADVRVRLPDRPADSLSVPLEPTWLGYQAADLAPRPFLHQLDFYLHFPPREQAEWFSRPAFEAAAAGCVVATPARYRGLYGDAAVYCTRSEVEPLIARYRADPGLFAAQSRRARQTVSVTGDPARFVERIMSLLPALLTIP
ncbi:glycosyltransferase family 2 protein [Actinoplanes sp. LDG1-06]|uniref:Glycosyltransferase family 2 protein n=1 Tax=Paractinoplanes ovalisporus TaxID=2810368 RepID=A0ABS2ACM9_9ACTN|nr:glycosyltransferase family A protein [Actinoplanes ovalisporus]MBM2617577.1 glycosyltransferase family 2 protein [Actinoplanes ovalisporus]